MGSKEASMAIVLPFKAVRPPAEHVAKVASPPYDVITADEARQMSRDNSISFLHVTKSEIDLPEGIDLYGDEVYETARQNFTNYLKQGILIQEEQPAFYIYCQKMGTHEQCGIGACIHIKEFEHGNVMRHEMTLPQKEADRTRHIDIVDAQTGPIFLTYRSSNAIKRLVKHIRERSKPEYDFCVNDVSQKVWVVKEEDLIRKIKEEFKRVERLYIADGHHRAASAVTVSKMRRAFAQKEDMIAPHDLILSVLFPHDELKIRDYNRLVRDLYGLTSSEFIEEIQKMFSLRPNYIQKSPQEAHEFGMYLEKKWYGLKAKKGSFDQGDIVGALDVYILHENLLNPILGIKDPRSDTRIRFVGATWGTDELERMVDSGAFQVAFSLFPPTVDQMMAVADYGKIMPPKSTWFEPKLMDGIIVHRLDQE
jgi:uncharacterized protein (DUF1015 family)